MINRILRGSLRRALLISPSLSPIGGENDQGRVMMEASKVSSTLNKDTKQFGKRNMFDDNCDTCWNSDHGSPQFVALEFPKPVSVRELRIRFQGGFAGQDCLLQIGGGRSQEMSKEISFHPKDSNNLQCFPMETETYHTSYKILFLSSTDLYGRITIYQMEMIGTISK